MSDGQPSTYAKPTTTTYGRCPAGTQPAGRGELVVQGVPTIANGGLQIAGAPRVSEAPQCDTDGTCNAYTGNRACVANYLGMRGAAAVYGTVRWQQPTGHGIDLVVDNAPPRRIQW